MSGNLFRIEEIDRLIDLEEPVLRLSRHFGPPRDYPHAVLERVRKQLPVTRAVYTLEGFREPPPLPIAGGAQCARAIVLRISTDSVSFLDLTGLPDERLRVQGQIYFGIDNAVTGTSQLSPNLGIPFSDIQVWLEHRWCPLTPANIATIRR